MGGVNVEWSVIPQIGLFGRYGFGAIDGRVSGSFDGFTETIFDGDTLNPSTWSAGVAFSDLLVEGARAAIAVGQPFIEDDVGNATQTNLETFYRIPLNDNLAISPDIQLIFNPNNNSANDVILVGTLRTTFKF